MTKSVNPQKAIELADIGLKYDELKTLRNRLIRDKMAEVEAEMQQAKAEFGLYLQSKVDRDNVGYKITVSDICRAMGTTARKTVYDFLGDAKARARNRFIDQLAGNAFKGLSIMVKKTWVGPFESHYFVVAVHDASTEKTYRAMLRGQLNRYTVWDVKPDAEDALAEDAVEGKGTEYPRNGNYPLDWLTWLDQNEEWLAFLESA